MRVFVAIDINSPEVLRKIKEFQSSLKLNAKSVAIENLHFTLQFLGEISEIELEKIKNSLQKIRFSEFFLELEGIGVFPNQKNPRIVWIGTDSEGGNNLKEIAKKVNDSLKQEGHFPDKSFKPHLTVFRVKNKISDMNQILENYEKTKFGNQEISSIKLKKSVLTSNGPIYSDIMEIKNSI